MWANKLDSFYQPDASGAINPQQPSDIALRFTATPALVRRLLFMSVAATLLLFVLFASPVKANISLVNNYILEEGLHADVVFSNGATWVLKVLANGSYSIIDNSGNAVNGVTWTTVIDWKEYTVVSVWPERLSRLVLSDDVVLYEKYVGQLPAGLDEFAYELIKWREEYKLSFSKTESNIKRMEKYKAKWRYTPKLENRSLDNAWKGFVNQLLDWVDSRRYDDVVTLAPDLAKYIYDNRELLSSADYKISYWIEKVVIHYKNQIATEENQIATEENQRITELNDNMDKLIGK